MAWFSDDSSSKNVKRPLARAHLKREQDITHVTNGKMGFSLEVYHGNGQLETD